MRLEDMRLEDMRLEDMRQDMGQEDMRQDMRQEDTCSGCSSPPSRCQKSSPSTLYSLHFGRQQNVFSTGSWMASTLSLLPCSSSSSSLSPQSSGVSSSSPGCSLTLLPDCDFFILAPAILSGLSANTAMGKSVWGALEERRLPFLPAIQMTHRPWLTLCNFRSEMFWSVAALKVREYTRRKPPQYTLSRNRL